MPANAQKDWMTTRRFRTTEAHAEAIQEGLTSFTVSGRNGKQLTLSDGGVYTEFVSCSYLGLEQHPDLMEAARTAMDQLGLHLSSSRGAMRPPHLRQLEERLSRIYQGGSAMVFTSTSNVHLGILPLLGSGSLANYPVGQAVHWLIDQTAHASMQVLRGILQQFGPASRVDSFDEQALTDTLKRCAAQGQTPILLIDGIGSMNSMVPVARLARKLSEAGGHIYVDDAHGISIAGIHGAGYAFAAVDHALPHNMILAGSLSKAFGGAGGFAVLADDRDYDAIATLANPLVFGHSIMLPMLAANVAAADIHLDGRIIELQARLWSNVETLDQMTGRRLMNAGMQSPIRGALFDSEEAGLAAARMFKQRGILLFPVFYPIVREGKAMLRFAISANHHPDEIRQLAQAIHAVGQSGLTWSNA
ncbi:aminotransferase [Chromobacterium amazonense]|uniref:Putative 8-amino-7-oxononanoate synthase n=1 Tax=Chromobacterium amazonense TaxID=1382803 RepID=A0A2S9X1Q1_9NEIS|nr:aminotransferase class I/II-fold pyridoxal phosphate-dependent enzyme [Chromobacterium amazonense]PRP69613.1 aminotransferase [Chromobacterium amazonense]